MQTWWKMETDNNNREPIYIKDLYKTAFNGNII